MRQPSDYCITLGWQGILNYLLHATASNPGKHGHTIGNMNAWLKVHMMHSQYSPEAASMQLALFVLHDRMMGGIQASLTCTFQLCQCHKAANLAAQS